VAVMLNVQLGGFGGVMVGVMIVSGCAMGVVGSLLVVAGLVALRGLAMVLGSLFVVLGGVQMMLSGVFRHGESFRDRNWVLANQTQDKSAVSAPH
jgi:hypothetical protein